MLRQRALVGGGQAGGSDHGRDLRLRAGAEVRKRALGTGEVDQDVGPGERDRDVGGDGHAGRRPAALAGVAPDQRAVRNLQRADQLEPGVGKSGIEQCLAHAAAAAGDGQPYSHQPSFLRRSCSQFVSPVFGASDSDLSRRASPPPERATSTGDGGISSFSQRASLSSTK